MQSLKFTCCNKQTCSLCTLSTVKYYRQLQQSNRKWLLMNRLVHCTTIWRAFHNNKSPLSSFALAETSLSTDLCTQRGAIPTYNPQIQKQINTNKQTDKQITKTHPEPLPIRTLAQLKTKVKKERKKRESCRAITETRNNKQTSF